jgi:DNA-directed RNA polymerase specialized sigma24 family protein
MNKLTEDEKRVRTELSKVFPQLQINARKVCGQGFDKWGDDLLQLSVEIYLEKPLDYQIKVIDDGKLENFITYTMNFQLKRGKTTRFWHTHRKFLNSTRELFVGTYDYKNPGLTEPFEDEISDLQECINKQMSKLDPFEKMLLTEKIQWGSKYTDIAKKYNIPYGQLQQGLKKTLNKIKEICQHLR